MYLHVLHIEPDKDFVLKSPGPDGTAFQVSRL